jgi:hypothetical protein
LFQDDCATHRKWFHGPRRDTGYARPSNVVGCGKIEPTPEEQRFHWSEGNKYAVEAMKSVLWPNGGSAAALLTRLAVSPYHAVLRLFHRIVRRWRRIQRSPVRLGLRGAVALRQQRHHLSWPMDSPAGVRAANLFAILYSYSCSKTRDNFSKSKGPAFRLVAYL